MSFAEKLTKMGANAKLAGSDDLNCDFQPLSGHWVKTWCKPLPAVAHPSKQRGVGSFSNNRNGHLHVGHRMGAAQHHSTPSSSNVARSVGNQAAKQGGRGHRQGEGGEARVPDKAVPGAQRRGVWVQADLLDMSKAPGSLAGS